MTSLAYIFLASFICNLDLIVSLTSEGQDDITSIGCQRDLMSRSLAWPI